jgi:hypothetical protein
MSTKEQQPKRIWWARPGKLCGLERPGGGGRSHRAERRDAEIAYLVGKGVRMCISTMSTRHNLGAYELAGLEWHHVPVESATRGADALEEILPLLRRELRRRGAVAVHGNRPRTSWPPCAPPTCTRRAGWIRRTHWRGRRRQG